LKPHKLLRKFLKCYYTSSQFTNEELKPYFDEYKRKDLFWFAIYQ